MILAWVQALILLVVTVIAWFAILFTGKHPEGLFRPARSAIGVPDPRLGVLPADHRGLSAVHPRGGRGRTGRADPDRVDQPHRHRLSEGEEDVPGQIRGRLRRAAEPRQGVLPLAPDHPLVHPGERLRPRRGGRRLPRLVRAAVHGALPTGPLQLQRRLPAVHGPRLRLRAAADGGVAAVRLRGGPPLPRPGGRRSAARALQPLEDRVPADPGHPGAVHDHPVPVPLWGGRGDRLVPHRVHGQDLGRHPQRPHGGPRLPAALDRLLPAGDRDPAADLRPGAGGQRQGPQAEGAGAGGRRQAQDDDDQDDRWRDGIQEAAAKQPAAKKPAASKRAAKKPAARRKPTGGKS